MTMRVFLVALLAFILCLDRAYAKDWMVRGDGQRSCGAWTKAQAHRPVIGPDNTYQPADTQIASQLAWVSGFLSAYDYYASDSGNVGNGIDANGLMAWIDNYCAAHPLDPIAKAALELVSELSNHKVH